MTNEKWGKGALTEKGIRWGEDLFAQGRFREAEECFLNLLKSGPPSAELYNNLAVICNGRQEYPQAIDYFTMALQNDPSHRDTIINYALLLRGLKLLHEAIPLLEKAAERHPEDKEIMALLMEARAPASPQKKIAVVCVPGLESFLWDIVAFFRKNYDVRTCYSNSAEEIASAVNWADIVWLEWANETAVHVSNTYYSKNDKKFICRLHSYEAFTPSIHKMRWETLDHVLFVAPHIRSIVLKTAKNLKVEKTSVLPNSVNTKTFSLSDKPRGFNLAYLGHINHKKGPMLLIHAFYELFKRDPRYRLFIGGAFQEPRYLLYYDQIAEDLGLRNNIHFEGWVKEVNPWFQDKHFIVCTSVMEGHPVGIMEAMACGLKPVVHTFFGAKGLYPERYLWRSIPEFVTMITSEDYHPKEYREFIERQYTLETQLSSIQRVISQLCPENQHPQLTLSPTSEPLSRSTPPVSHGCPSPMGFITEQEVKSFYNAFLSHLKRDHTIPNARHQRAKQSLARIIRPGMTVLDIGCGTGLTSHFMAELGAYVTAVDLSDDLIGFAKENAAHPHVTYLVQDATKLALGDTFDAITIIDSLEHIMRRELNSFFSAIRRHTSDQTVIYLNIPDGRFQRYMRKHYPEKLQIIDEDYNPEFIIERFRSLGFEPTEMALYGIDAPIQYNEYIFRTNTSLEGMFQHAFKQKSL